MYNHNSRDCQSDEIPYSNRYSWNSHTRKSFHGSRFDSDDDFSTHHCVENSICTTKVVIYIKYILEKIMMSIAIFIIAIMRFIKGYVIYNVICTLHKDGKYSLVFLILAEIVIDDIFKITLSKWYNKFFNTNPKMKSH